MPLPWAASRARIPQVECRGITVQQLRELQIYLQRLCKTGLLKKLNGERIEWFEVNMYDISDLVVKPTITCVEETRGSNERYSWVEFVSTAKEQRPQVMFSHSWAGRFRDFMAVVDTMVRSRGLSCSTVIWVCTFANSQFGEDFGACLRDSPFYRAIQLTEETLLVVDRETSSLQRIWCGFELHLTMQMNKPLHVYTSAGQVGVTVTSGRLVEAVEEWDVVRMEASQDSDRRQILNYLGGGELRETDGLEKDEHSNMILVDGWKKLLDPNTTATTEDAPKRASGQPEYAFEANLFAVHKDAYDKLNNSVRTNVLCAAKVEKTENQGREPIPVHSFADRGVTLGELRTFAKNLRRAVEAERGEQSYESLLVEDTLPFLEREMGCNNTSYVEWLGVGPRRPSIVIDEVFTSSFSDLISTVDWFAEAQKLPESVVLYFTLLCRNAFDHYSEPVGWDTGIQTLLMNCDALLSVLPLDDHAGPELIVRSNKMQQLHFCFQKNKDVYLGCRDGIIACTSPFLDHSWVFGDFDARTAKIILGADWKEARCGDESVRKRIFEQVSASRGGIEAFGKRLARTVAGPVMRDVARRVGDSSALDIAGVASSSGFMPNTPVLQGSLGETPTHVAAACGNLQALAAVLDFKADPNAQDHLRETPMHYAAFSGQVAAVRMLLSYGAHSSAESAFAESPLVVAEQNPAGFLIGADGTKAVAELLKAWEHADVNVHLKP